MATLTAMGMAEGSMAYTPPPQRRLATRLFLGSMFATGAMVVCYLFMVHIALGQQLDEAAYLGAVKEDHSNHVGSARDLLNQITVGSLVLFLVLLVVFGLGRHRLLLRIGAALAAGATVVVADFLKHYVFTRPDLTDQGSAGGNTFPSGHTSIAAACAMALIILSPTRWRGAVALLAGAYAWIVAAQVQVVGWHRPSDAIGGALLAFAFASFVAGLFA